jgi:SAM-dependent methyltransferase
MWKMQFNDEVKQYFINGIDEETKRKLHHIIITKNTSPLYKCLQIGVPHTLDRKFGDNWVSIDLFDNRPCIDHKMDLHNLEFPDNYFDFIECNAILEHVKNPFKCAEEIKRVLKPGGGVWIEVPFVQAYHPSKDYNEEINGIIYEPEDKGNNLTHGGDYWRFTPQGIKELFEPLNCYHVYQCNEGGIAYYGRKEGNKEFDPKYFDEEFYVCKTGYKGGKRDQNNPTYKDFSNRIFKAFESEDIKTILDIGGGVGYRTLNYQAKGYDAWTFDVSEYAYQHSVNPGKHICEDITQNYIPGTNVFDLVIAERILGYIDPEKSEQALLNIEKFSNKWIVLAIICQDHVAGDWFVEVARPGRINIQPKKFWMHKVQKLGWIQDELKTEIMNAGGWDGITVWRKPNV